MTTLHEAAQRAFQECCAKAMPPMNATGVFRWWFDHGWRSALAQQGEQQPVGFMSPKQVERIQDPEDESGRYIPMRKTAAGNFTLALYAGAAPAAQPDARKAMPPVASPEMLAAAREVLGSHVEDTDSDYQRIYAAFYAAAPAPAAQPLTTQQRDDLWNALPAHDTNQDYYIRGILDAERHHKIGAQK